jgi:DNA-binding transcriptional LysR family regulator
MEISEIGVFVKVVQTGSFGKAAQALKVSKSTVNPSWNGNFTSR